MRLGCCVGLLFLALASLLFSALADDPLDQWALRNPLPTANQLWSLIFHDHLFVAVGDAGQVLTSPDAVDWTVQSTPTLERLRSVTHGAGLFVAVGDAGTILTSPDGSAWSSANSGTEWELHGLAYGNGTFVVTGIQGVILTSPDGSNWTTQSSETTADLESVAFGDGQFVAVGGYYITTRYEGVLLVSSDGIHWTNHTPANPFQIHYSSVAYDHGTFVVMRSSGYLTTSTNATTWTPQFPVNPPPPTFNRTAEKASVEYGYPSNEPQPFVTLLNSKLFAIWPATELRSSTNGVVWARNLDASNGDPLSSARLSSAVFGDGKYVVTGNAAIYTSNDGTNWVNRVSQRSDRISFVCYANSNFITHPLQSFDGAVWTPRRLPQDSPKAVAQGNGLWAAVGWGSQNLLISTNGLTWQSQPADGQNRALNGIAYGNNTFVVVGGTPNFENVILTSADGRHWQTQTVTNIGGFTGIAFGNGRFVALCPTRSVATSIDGTHWTVQEMAVPQIGELDYSVSPHGGIAFGNGRFVLIGPMRLGSWPNMTSGLVALSSTNGLNWSKSLFDTNWLRVGTITFGNGYFAALAEDKPVSAVFTSHNGIQWKKHPLRTKDLLFDITFGNGSFVAVGENAVIYQSAPVLPPYEVSIAAELDAFVPGTDPGLVRMTRLGRVPLDVDLLVQFALSGTAKSGVDYVSLSNSVVIPAGSSFVDIPVFAKGSLTLPGTKTLMFALQPGEAYSLGAEASAVVSIVNPGPAPRFRTSSLQAQDGAVRFTIDGMPGASFGVEATSDWREWSPLRTVNALSGSVEAMDSLQSGGPGQRFYRARLVGP